MSSVKRNVGRPPMTEEQRKAKEPTIDTHLNVPDSVVKAVDAERKDGESRKDCIVRLLKERLNMSCPKIRRHDMIPLGRFAAQHSVDPLDVTRAINMQVLEPDDIKQKDGTTLLMLDSEGRRAFWESLHDAGTWRDCSICPHELY